jgi:hypothetical protein
VRAVENNPRLLEHPAGSVDTEDVTRRPGSTRDGGRGKAGSRSGVHALKHIATEKVQDKNRQRNHKELP